MTENKTLSWISLQKYLSNRTMLERFLTELIGRKIILNHSPREADIFSPIFEENVYAVDEDGVRYCIVIQTQAFDFWWKQLEYIGALNGVNTDRDWGWIKSCHKAHIIAICGFDPFHQGKSYYRPELQIKDTEGNFIDDGIVESHLQYHICCAHPDARSGAPKCIQQILDILSGTGGEEVPELLQNIYIDWDERDSLYAQANGKVAKAYQAARKANLARECDIIEFINDYGEGFVLGMVESEVKILNRLNSWPNLESDSEKKELMKCVCDTLPDKFYERILQGEELKEKDYYQWFMDRKAVSFHTMTKCIHYIQKSD